METNKTAAGSVVFVHATPVRIELTTRILTEVPKILEDSKDPEQDLYNLIKELIFKATQGNEVIILPDYVVDEEDIQVEEIVPQVTE